MFVYLYYILWDRNSANKEMKYKHLFINVYMTYFSDNHAGSVRQHVTELWINNEYVISNEHYR